MTPAGKARRQQQPPTEPRNRLMDQCERVQILLLVVEDVAGDARAAKAPELEQRLASRTITCRPLATSTRIVSTRAGGSKRPSIAAMSRRVMSATS